MFNLDDAIVDYIEFSQKRKIGNKGNIKVVSLSSDDDKFEGRRIRADDDLAIASRELTFNKIDSRVRYRRGDTVETDVNCDSDYMLSAMNRVGNSIRSAYHWIPQSEPWYLVMDNVSGHGTEEAIEKHFIK